MDLLTNQHCTDPFGSNVAIHDCARNRPEQQQSAAVNIYLWVVSNMTLVVNTTSRVGGTMGLLLYDFILLASLYMESACLYLFNIITKLLLYPMKLLFLNGPLLHGYGFWQGASFETICASASGTDALFWVQHVDECHLIVDRKILGFALSIYFMLIITIIYIITNAMIMRYLYVQPFLHEMEQVRAAFYTTPLVDNSLGTASSTKPLVIQKV